MLAWRWGCMAGEWWGREEKRWREFRTASELGRNTEPGCHCRERTVHQRCGRKEVGTREGVQSRRRMLQVPRESGWCCGRWSIAGLVQTDSGRRQVTPRETYQRGECTRWRSAGHRWGHGWCRHWEWRWWTVCRNCTLDELRMTWSVRDGRENILNVTESWCPGNKKVRERKEVRSDCGNFWEGKKKIYKKERRKGNRLASSLHCCQATNGAGFSSSPAVKSFETGT